MMGHAVGKIINIGVDAVFTPDGDYFYIYIYIIISNNVIPLISHFC